MKEAAQHKHRTGNGGATVYVIDDDQAVRGALKNLIRSVGITVELFASTDEFLSRGRWSRPGCLVLDVRLPGRSGLDFQDDLARSDMTMPIIFISGYSDVPMSVRAMKAGAVDFITKPVRPQDMLDAIQNAVSRDVVSYGQAQVAAELKARYSKLTLREREVFSLVVTGLMNKQIAASLAISEATVKLHWGT